MELEQIPAQHVREVVLIDVALAALRVARDPVADELMRHGARDALDEKRQAHVLTVERCPMSTTMRIRRASSTGSCA